MPRLPEERSEIFVIMPQYLFGILLDVFYFYKVFEKGKHVLIKIFRDNSSPQEPPEVTPWDLTNYTDYDLYYLFHEERLKKVGYGDKPELITLSLDNFVGELEKIFKNSSFEQELFELFNNICERASIVFEVYNKKPTFENVVEIMKEGDYAYRPYLSVLRESTSGDTGERCINFQNIDNYLLCPKELLDMLLGELDMRISRSLEELEKDVTSVKCYLPLCKIEKGRRLGRTEVTYRELTSYGERKEVLYRDQGTIRYYIPESQKDWLKRQIAKTDEEWEAFCKSLFQFTTQKNFCSIADSVFLSGNMMCAFKFKQLIPEDFYSDGDMAGAEKKLFSAYGIEEDTSILYIPISLPFEPFQCMRPFACYMIFFNGEELSETFLKIYLELKLATLQYLLEEEKREDYINKRPGGEPEEKTAIFPSLGIFSFVYSKMNYYSFILMNLNPWKTILASSLIEYDELENAVYGENKEHRNESWKEVLKALMECFLSSNLRDERFNELYETISKTFSKLITSFDGPEPPSKEEIIREVDKIVNIL
jgi:hypothetical protein